MSTHFIGITALTDFFLNEGVDPLLDRLQDAGATALACNPTVTAPAAEGDGSFQPPTDAGASVRLFDRPLWGKYSLWVRGAPSYRPRTSLYQECPYQPRAANELTDQHGAIVQEILRKAHRRGLQVHFQLGAAQPPGLHEEDIPRLPDGSLPQGRMANTASLASPAVRAYNRCYLADLLREYPDLDGIRVDWPEYPCYTLDEVFADFGPHAEAFAVERGYDFARMRSEVGALWSLLRDDLHDAALSRMLDYGVDNYAPLVALGRYPGIADWLRLKADLSADLLRDWREALDAAGGGAVELSANAFAPPWCALTGLDPGRAAEHCSSVSAKLYTMHWALMVKFWGDRILQTNGPLNEPLLVRVLVRLMDIADVEGGQRLADYAYPEPDQPHPISERSQISKLNQAVAAAGGRTRLNALLHGYGPLDDFQRRLRLVGRSRVDGLWVNRYGYLSNDKLAAIGEFAADWSKAS